MGPRNDVLDGGWHIRAVPPGTIGGVPYGATKRCTGWWLTHAGGPTGTVGGVPYGATKRYTGW
eukprot:6430185-Pyramimonas_sp.AAC.1